MTHLICEHQIHSHRSRRTTLFVSVKPIREFLWAILIDFQECSTTEVLIGKSLTFNSRHHNVKTTDEDRTPASTPARTAFSSEHPN